ncbi:unnamed protein product [Laminaria digitata]
MSEPYLPPEDVGGGGAEMRVGRDPGEFFVRVGKLFVAGTVGGLGECLASYPLDTVKTRMQTQTGSAGVLDCFSVAIREGGPLALYRGMSSRLVASMIAASVMFGANGTLKELFHADSRQPLSGRFIAAAAGTGVLEAIAYCPLELVKTRMQVLRGSPPPGVTVWSTGLQIYRQFGLFKGCYKGFSSMVLREAPGNLVFFGSYELSKQVRAGGRLSALSSLSAVGDRSGFFLRAPEGEAAGVAAVASAGGVAGVLYTAAVHPVDTVKSLIQTDSIEAPKYRGFVDGLRHALARGGGGVRGFASLYRGLSPAIGRAFIGNAVLFLTYESVLDALG